MSYCEMAQNLISLIFPIFICNHPTKKFRVCLRLGSDIYNPSGSFRIPVGFFISAL